MENTITIIEKFIFSATWLKKHYDAPDRLTKHQAILNMIFAGSKSSSCFIGNCVTHNPSEKSYNKYVKAVGQSFATKFIEKVYPIFLELGEPTPKIK